MEKPNREFIYQGEYFPLDCPPQRAGKVKIEQRFNELKSAYETGFSKLSNYSGSAFGEIQLKKTIIYKTDSPITALQYAMDNSDLILIPASTSIGAYGSVSVLTFHKNAQMIAEDLKQLHKLAEEEIEQYVKGFNHAKAAAISNAVHQWSQFEEYQESLKHQEQQCKEQEAEFYRSLQ